MGDITFNVAKGRAVEFYNRVKSNDPANSALVVVLLASAGLVGDTTMKDYATLADVLAGASDEATNTGYARKVLTDADLAAFPGPDNATDSYKIPIPNQTWVAVANDGTGGIGKLLVCLDLDTTAGTDADIIPISAHDFVIATPSGIDIDTEVAADGFYEAGE